MSIYSELLTRIQQKSAVIGIIGLGYVGLPLAREFAESGFSVLGFDIDSQKIEKLNRGDSYIHAVSQETLLQIVEAGRFSATEDFSRLREVDAVVICVPTPLDRHKNPDLQYVEKTAHTIAENCRAGQVIVLESTTYPGTTRDVLCPILESSGLTAHEDIFVGYSPERENPGDAKWRTRDIPKVVGADNELSLKLLVALYNQVVTQVVPVSSTLAAEASKLLENIYRCVNIALVNELKMLFDRMDIDVFEVIEASKTKPFGFKAFYPGPGLGGHCIPIDPFYLSWKAREFDTQTRFIELAGEVNSEMPNYVIQKCVHALNLQRKSVADSKILVLGVAYKENVDDIRESPALIIIDKLRQMLANVTYHDPFVARIPYSRSVDVSDLKSVELTDQTLIDADLVLIITAHENIDYSRVATHARVIVDTRNAIAKHCGKNTVKSIQEKLFLA